MDLIRETRNGKEEVSDEVSRKGLSKDNLW